MRKYLPFMLASLMLSCISAKEDNSQFTYIDEALEQTLSSSFPDKGKESLILPNSTELDKIPQDPKNPLSNEKVELGKLLFHETSIGRATVKQSGAFTYSCSSCHHSEAGFQSCLPQGIGEGGIGYGMNGENRTLSSTYQDSEVDAQPIRTPSILNVAYHTNILWNGQFGSKNLNLNTQANWTKGTPKENNFLGFDGVETQAIAAQDLHRIQVSKIVLDDIPTYKEMFRKAFPSMNLNDNFQLKVNTALAIAAYERTLLATEAPFQKWLRGDFSAMTDAQKEGAILFFSKAECYYCHSGPSLASMNFYAVGMNDLKNGDYGGHKVVAVTDSKPEHKGRGGFTGKAEDMYKFKVPQLYNLKDSPFYGHGSSFTQIEDVVAYKIKGVAQNKNVPASQIAPQFHSRNLTNAEILKITDFIKNGLYDANLKRYTPQKLPSGLAFPNNDAQSIIDLGF